MESSVQTFLVFVPFYDNVPHSMRLRLREGMPSDELLGQIERQLEAENASEVKVPLSPALYVPLLFHPVDNAFLPFEGSTYDVQVSCSKLLLYRRGGQQTENEAPRVSAAPAAKIRAPPNDSNELVPMPDCPTATCEASEERARFQRTTETMLRIVEQVVSELALRCDSNCELTEKSWPTMMAWALDKGATSMDRLDITVVDQFKKSLLNSLSCGNKIRSKQPPPPQ